MSTTYCVDCAARGATWIPLSPFPRCATCAHRYIRTLLHSTTHDDGGSLYGVDSTNSTVNTPVEPHAPAAMTGSSTQIADLEPTRVGSNDAPSSPRAKAVFPTHLRSVLSASGPGVPETW
jgi:hypothetical protein